MKDVDWDKVDYEKGLTTVSIHKEEEEGHFYFWVRVGVATMMIPDLEDMRDLIEMLTAAEDEVSLLYEEEEVIESDRKLGV